MYRPPDVETLSDFYQYYRGSWVGLRGTKPEDPHAIVPAMVSNCSRDAVIFTLEDGSPRPQTIGNILNNVQFGAPQYGSAEYSNTCVYVSRKALRTQYRGHRRSGLVGHIFHPQTGIPPIGTLLQSWTYVTSLFKGTSKTIPEAYKELTSGKRLASTLNRRFTLSLEPNIQVPVLYYGTDMIGYVPAPEVVELAHGSGARILVEDSFPNVKIYAE